MPPIDPRVARSRAKIMAAATELIIEGGTSAATADAIAARAGVSKATLYRHWSSQVELLADTFRSNVPDLVAPTQAPDYETALRGLLELSVAHLSCPRWRKLLPAMVAFPLRVPEADEIMQADHGAKVAAMTAILELGRAEGHSSAATDPETALSILIGPLIFATLLDRGADLAALADAVLDRFLGH